MSADNWAQCPKCLRTGIRTLRQLQKEAEDAYGKVPEDEYIRLKEKAKGPVSFPSETLREDYGLSIDPETWTFRVWYSASCSECGFHFEYKDFEQVKP